MIFLKGNIMKLLKSAAMALGILVVTASTAYARDYYSVGINVGNYPMAYSSAYDVGYTHHSRVIHQPTVVYYSAPIRCYEPMVIRSGFYGDNRHHGYHNNYRGHDNRGRGQGRHGRGENRGWGHGHHGHN